jgi:hypothetical protein
MVTNNDTYFPILDLQINVNHYASNNWEVLGHGKKIQMYVTKRENIKLVGKLNTH